MGAAATLRDELDAATAALEAAGVPEARVDAEWLLAGLMGLGRARLRMDLGREVPAALAKRLGDAVRRRARRSEEHTSELQSLRHLVCRLLLEKKKKRIHCVRAKHT